MLRVQGTVDLAALHHNLSIVRRYAPRAQVMAVVKANAYGHGSVVVSRSLEPDVDGFAVATIEEAVKLREAGISASICVLSGFFSESHLGYAIDYELDVAVHCSEQIDLIALIRGHGRISVWLKVNTGMNRLGFSPERFATAVSRLRALKTVAQVRLMSHFASADACDSGSASRQLAQFNSCTKNLGLERSIANSAGLIRDPANCLEWVRPGIMLYGASPFTDLSSAQLNLRPVMNLYSILIAVNNVGRGDAVGYGGEWIAPKDSRVGIVACGYADGYPRSAAPGAVVMVGGSRVPVVGRISMDTFAVDLSECPRSKVGMRVKLFGDGAPVEDLANSAGTIPYDVLTAVASRTASLGTI